jgi:hypothetical protein
MAIIDFVIDGIDRLIDKLRGAPNRTDDEIRNILYFHGSKMFEQSQIQCPVGITGNLRDSGMIEKVMTGPPEVLIGYGNSAVQYAAAVHEMPTETTNWSTPGTKGKYLEDPVNAGIPEMKRALGQHVSRKIEGLR